MYYINIKCISPAAFHAIVLDRDRLLMGNDSVVVVLVKWWKYVNQACRIHLFSTSTSNPTRYSLFEVDRLWRPSWMWSCPKDNQLYMFTHLFVPRRVLLWTDFLKVSVKPVHWFKKHLVNGTLSSFESLWFLDVKRSVNNYRTEVQLLFCFL